MRAKKKKSEFLYGYIFFKVAFFTKGIIKILFIKRNCTWTVSGVQTVKGGGRDPY